MTKIRYRVELPKPKTQRFHGQPKVVTILYGGFDAARDSHTLAADVWTFEFDVSVGETFVVQVDYSNVGGTRHEQHTLIPEEIP